jgi:hypothetical protein
MPVRTCVRLAMKIKPKLSSSPLNYFTKHLMGAFRKPP